MGSPVRFQLYLKLHREVPTLPGARMCQAAAQQVPRCLRSTACASSGLMSLEHCLKSAAVCCGPSCGLIFPTGAQAPSLRSRQGARSAVGVPHCCATEAVGVYLLAMWRNALSGELVRLTGSVSNIPQAGEQCSCVWLAGQPTTFDLCVALTTTGIVAAL